MIGRYRSVQAYFADAIDAAATRTRIDARAEVRAYLVRLLDRFSGATHAAAIGEPLAILLERAAAAPAARQAGAYRQLGDLALVVGGFFAEVLERRGTSSRYVSGLGRDAYLRAAALAMHDASAALISELGRRFEDWSTLLDDVRERSAIGDSADLAQAVERWLNAPSGHALARLYRRGVVPIGGPRDRQ